MLGILLTFSKMRNINVNCKMYFEENENCIGLLLQVNKDFVVGHHNELHVTAASLVCSGYMWDV